MNFPRIKEVASNLRAINANVEAEPITANEAESVYGCDVRLQLWPDGDWTINWGPSDYDISHQGYWGASSVPGVVNGQVKRFNSTDLARELITQVKDHYYQVNS